MIILLEKLDNSWINNHLRFVLSKIYNRRETEITKGFLSTLEELNLSERGITDLKGIQFANNLSSLNLDKNNIINVNYLKNLNKLTNLELSQNKIEDMSFITNLKKLKTVNLESNNISSVPNLQNLKNLISINLSNNKIYDLSPIINVQSQNIKIIATNQCILLKPRLVYRGCDFTFTPSIYWNKTTPVLCDNIQVTGEYLSIHTDERTSLEYSISNATIINISSDCILKADFYHNVPFGKSGTLSGVIIQPIMVRLTQSQFDINDLKRLRQTGLIYGNLHLEHNTEYKHININVLKNKTITIINSDGDKIYSFTNSKGEFEFQNLKIGRYTLLYPFIVGYKYLKPSLYILNLKEDDCIEINSIISPTN